MDCANYYGRLDNTKPRKSISQFCTTDFIHEALIQEKEIFKKEMSAYMRDAKYEFEFHIKKYKDEIKRLEHKIDELEHRQIMKKKIKKKTREIVLKL